MEITIDKNVQKRLHRVSKMTGLDQRELAHRAIVLYLENMRGMADFITEISAWQELGGESLRLFETSLRRNP